MDFKDLCLARQSCRQYSGEPVPQEKLDYIRECVRLAPSAVNKQPWRFLLIDKKEQLEKIYDCYNRDWIRSAPIVVICLKNEAEAWKRGCDGHNHADIDIAIATEHLCLAATEQGLGNCWVCNFDVDRLVSTGLIPEGFTPAVLVPLGMPADEPRPKTRKPMNEVWG